jgi:hypothetical protein
VFDGSPRVLCELRVFLQATGLAKACCEPATKLGGALQRSGNSFAIGWDLICGEEQALLD